MAHLHDEIEDKARTDGRYAIAYALLQLARAQEATATHLKYMGAGDVHGPGALELVAKEIKEGTERLATYISEALDQRT